MCSCAYVRLCVCLAVLLVSLVHPLVVHWVWAEHSWLNKVSSCKVLDFAGGLPVHALGKWAA